MAKPNYRPAQVELIEFWKQVYVAAVRNGHGSSSANRIAVSGYDDLRRLLSTVGEGVKDDEF